MHFFAPFICALVLIAPLFASNHLIDEPEQKTVTVHSLSHTCGHCSATLLMACGDVATCCNTCPSAKKATSYVAHTAKNILDSLGYETTYTCLAAEHMLRGYQRSLSWVCLKAQGFDQICDKLGWHNTAEGFHRGIIAYKDHYGPPVIKMED